MGREDYTRRDVRHAGGEVAGAGHVLGRGGVLRYYFGVPYLTYVYRFGVWGVWRPVRVGLEDIRLLRVASRNLG